MRGTGERGIETKEREEAPLRAEERPEEEGGREVRMREGQALLLKAEERAEERAREEERGVKERGGQMILLRPEAVKAAEEVGEARVAGAGQVLKAEERVEERAGRRAVAVPYITPLRGEPKAGRLGEELRRRLLGWRIGELPYTPLYVGGGGVEEVSPYVVQGILAPSTASAQSEAQQLPAQSEAQQTSPEVQQPQQAGQAAAVPPYVVQGTPQFAAEEAPPPPALLAAGWPWHTAEGGGGVRYRPGRQRERLVL
jgi:hypothetical protein